MKDLFETSAQVSKEFVAKAGAKAQDLGEKGYKASKDILQKAGSKAQDLGETAILKLEIKQLEGQAQKFIGRLGTEVYSALVEHETPGITAETPAIKAILAEIASVKEGIEKREQELQGRKG
jgi:cell division septum initiation protein DivIVA